MNWRIKGCIQKVLGMLPGGAALHYALQRRFGGLSDFAAECDAKIDDWRLMMGHLSAVGIDARSSRFLEMGTGWYPTFPLCLYMAGAAKVETVDLTRHLRPDLTAACAGRLARYIAVIADASGAAATDVAKRQRTLADALDRGESLGSATNGIVSYRAPCDASATGLEPASIDVVFSNSVLEHVPGAVIAASFDEARRILRPRGIVFHSVNCGDHYAYVDHGIDQLHYLRYSDRAWRFWNNAFLYQNRLRAIDFTQSARDAGFVIEVNTARASPQRLAQLEATPVHPEFARYAHEQLAITSIDFVGRSP